MLKNKIGLSSLLALVFVFNYLETTVETWFKNRSGLGLEMGYKIAYEFHGLEGNYSFVYHDVTNDVAVIGYSISYFFILPMLFLAVVFSLIKRKDISPYRVFSLALTIDYLVSLPFFLFFPVPERWYFPDSQAMLLSDKWTSNLIEALRPISGLDNCFPSFHVSMTVVFILVCYIFKVRLRTPVLALGVTIILSTFVLGIHWLPDMIAGLAVGVSSVMLALRLDHALLNTERNGIRSNPQATIPKIKIENQPPKV